MKFLKFVEEYRKLFPEATPELVNEAKLALEVSRAVLFTHQKNSLQSDLDISIFDGILSN